MENSTNSSILFQGFQQFARLRKVFPHVSFPDPVREQRVMRCKTYRHYRHGIIVNHVDEQHIRAYVKLPEPSPLADESVIAVFGGQGVPVRVGKGFKGASHKRGGGPCSA